MTMSILQDDNSNEMKKTYNIPGGMSHSLHITYGANDTIFTNARRFIPLITKWCNLLKLVTF